jgi:amidase
MTLPARPVMPMTDVSSADKRVHAFSGDLLGERDATDLATAIRSGELHPREVVEATMIRAHKVEHAIHAIELTVHGQALRDAQRPLGGFFAGVPMYVKDNTDIAGIPSQHGSDAVNGRPARKHSGFGAQLMAQGFVCMGKSRMPEFGLNASTEFVNHPPTRNPWNIDHSCGASSGGAAALVAAGVIPMAHANDGGGSIRIPAACCGLVGLKPSRGRLIDVEAASKLPINLVADGMVSRSVRDTARFFAEAERYYRNTALPAVGLVEGPGKQRLRIGVVEESLAGAAYDQPTRAALDDAVKLFEGMGHQCERAILQHDKRFADDFGLYWAMLAFILHRGGKLVMGRHFEADRLDSLTLGLSRRYQRNLLKTPGFLRRLKHAATDYAAWFSRYDVILAPTLSHSVPALGHLSPAVSFDELYQRLMNYLSMTPVNNVTGTPGISLPMGQSPDGLPIGMHLCAPMGAESTLLELAFEVEAAQPWRRIQG